MKSMHCKSVPLAARKLVSRRPSCPDQRNAVGCDRQALADCRRIAGRDGLPGTLLWFSTKPAGKARRPGELVLYCATGFIKPVEEICADYEKEYGVKVHIDPDSSGALLSKLRVAPERADLFLSGEESFMREARQQKLVAEVLPVARQHVVLAVAPGNPQKIAGLADLLPRRRPRGAAQSRS